MVIADVIKCSLPKTHYKMLSDSNKEQKPTGKRMFKF
ncbi:hypothetical protein ELBR111191_02425 [Elizabethkingia bruuniana]